MQNSSSNGGIVKGDISLLNKNIFVCARDTNVFILKPDQMQRQKRSEKRYEWRCNTVCQATFQLYIYNIYNIDLELQ